MGKGAGLWDKVKLLVNLVILVLGSLMNAVGVVEAPRGVLIHHYQTDDRGIVQKVNLIVATAHNYPAMNMSIKKARPEPD
jgi:coenzyme F420-reducing hydrogenase alpha subunit